MKNKNLLSAFTTTFILSCISLFSAAQSSVDTIIDHVAEIERISAIGSKTYLTSYIFDSILHITQNQISGIQVKNGKTASTSATLQDKSMTLNVNIKAWDRFFLQPTISGSSTKDFISIFSGDKYQRTLTGGVNLIFFSKSTGHFDSTDRIYIHNVLRYIKSLPPTKEPNELKDVIGNFITAFDIAYPLFDSMERKEFDFNSTDTSFRSRLICLEEMYRLAPKLIKAKILTSDWDQYYAKDIRDHIEKLKIIREAHNWDKIYQLKYKLAKYDSVQRGAWWTGFTYFWFSGGLQFNQAINPIFDSTAGASKLFTHDDYDQFFTAQFSINFLKSNNSKGVNTWFFPTFKFNTQKIFNSDSLFTIQKQSRLIVGQDTLNMVNKTTSFYLNDVQRKPSLTFELPMAKYWTDQHLGIDLSASFTFLPKFDQLAARAGVYIPITAADKVVIIEPLLNFTKLNKGHLVFLKDQLAFGFSISVSIPKFITGG